MQQNIKIIFFYDANSAVMQQRTGSEPIFTAITASTVTHTYCPFGASVNSDTNILTAELFCIPDI